MRRSECNDVAACGTTDFEHAGARYGRYVQPEHVGDGRELTQRRLREGIRRVGRGVVVGTQPIHRVGAMGRASRSSQRVLL